MESTPESVSFKPAFVERYTQLTDFATFKACSVTYLRKSIRVNTLKITVPELLKRLETNWKLTPIPWCSEGFWIEHRGKEDEKRRDIGNLIEHSLGYIYVQEAASMIPPVVLNPQPHELILDMCAAPGSKTTQIAQAMGNTGLLVANDYDIDRIKALSINTERCGLTNLVITRMQGQQFKDMQFDRVLVDAPCSGTGTIRKSYKTLLMWNPSMVKRLSHLQKKLIATAFNLVKPGGVLVYSTCTLEPEENEAVVSYLLETYSDAYLEDIELPLQRSPAVLEFEEVCYNTTVQRCLRIWPQDNDTEGFFVAKIGRRE